MQTIKSAALKTKNHIYKHRAKYAVVATAITAYAISRESVRQWNEFLEEKGLTDEFYCPEELEELTA